jgi:hypothetical protein
MSISGPIPPYTNPPIEPQFYNPSRFEISDITRGRTTTVFSTSNFDYPIGQQIRLLIPPSFGCIQLNNATGYVLSLPSATSVEVSIDSSINVSPFNSSAATTKPQILPIGDINSGKINSNGRINNGVYIEGSFINVS